MHFAHHSRHCHVVALQYFTRRGLGVILGRQKGVGLGSLDDFEQRALSSPQDRWMQFS